jgi:hypothetical protein
MSNVTRLRGPSERRRPEVYADHYWSDVRPLPRADLERITGLASEGQAIRPTDALALVAEILRSREGLADLFETLAHPDPWVAAGDGIEIVQSLLGDEEMAVRAFRS